MELKSDEACLQNVLDMPKVPIPGLCGLCSPFADLQFFKSTLVRSSACASGNRVTCMCTYLQASDDPPGKTSAVESRYLQRSCSDDNGLRPSFHNHRVSHDGDPRQA